MKTKLRFILFLCTSLAISQTDTEIFLFDIEIENSVISIDNGKNISNNNGYDNQPSFFDTDNILFSSTRNGQTDIRLHNIKDNSHSFLCDTEGSEYTPLKIPQKNRVSAIRLDLEGKQRLYSYDMDTGSSNELFNDLVAAYYTWVNKDIIVAAVIEGKNLDLYRINLKKGTQVKMATNVGRSLHQIPNSNLVSFISKQNSKQWQIKSLNPETGRIRLIANTIKNVEDICWLNNRNLLSGKGSSLYKLKLKQDYNWKKVADLSDMGIVTITRIKTDGNGSRLLMAAEISVQRINAEYNVEKNSAAQIVQKHIEPLKNKILDAFVKAFDKDVTVRIFPDQILYQGRKNLKENYEKFFEQINNSNVKVLNRMTLNNVVVDEELVTLDNITKRQVTVYETDDENINSMTFIENSTYKKKSEVIINKQLQKYNEKDIKAFGRTYANDVEIYNYPNTLIMEGRSALRNHYISLFENTPDLYAEIDNRIVLGNKIIDKEKVRMNGKFTQVIVIYEIRNSLIQRVTFIQ